MTHTPHDALFMAAFQKPEHAAAEFRALLPKELVRRIDWRTLTLQPGSFVDRKLRRNHSDLLFSASIDDADAFIYLLFEHQSTNDRFLVFRMLLYVVRIWEQYLSEFPGAKYLPPVLPVLIHHSEKGWTSPSRLSELLRPSPDDVAELRGYVPDMGIWVDDISNLGDPVLRARALAPFPSLAIAALRDARRPGRIAPLLHTWAKALKALARARDGRRALEQFFRYIALVAKELDRGELEHEVAQLLSSKEVSIVTTMFEKAMQEGHDKGLREGHDKGLREGHDKGLREGQVRFLVRLLELKFGTLSPSARRRVEHATLPTLSRWAERVLTAKSVRQVLDG